MYKYLDDKRLLKLLTLRRGLNPPLAETLAILIALVTGVFSYYVSLARADICEEFIYAGLTLIQEGM